jgi:hypothetical protein
MYRANYWDIDDFLAEEEPVTMISQRNLKKLGYLDPNNK